MYWGKYKGTIPRYGVPDRIVFLEALPKTSVGKLDKKALRGRYAQDGAMEEGRIDS